MKIYTKTGDAGDTALVGGTRVSKSHIRIDAYGTIDELNSWVGLLGDYTINKTREPFLRDVQKLLFTIGAILATEPDKQIAKIPALQEDDILNLENEIDNMNELLEPMRYFILPGGNKEVSFAHVARTVCRRAERLVVRLSETEPVDHLVIKFLNRLSDYLFVLCRMMAKDMDVIETPWQPRL